MNVASAIHISSNALILLGEEPIQSFDEEGSGARVAKNMYDTMYRAMLSNYEWNFATKEVKLDRLKEEPVYGNWKYMFQLPSDHIRTITTMPHQDYDILEDRIYADDENIYLTYIFRVEESFLPPMFREAFELYCAAKWANPVRENATLANTYFVMYQKQLKEAKRIDSQAKPNRGSVEAAAIPMRLRNRSGKVGRRGWN